MLRQRYAVYIVRIWLEPNGGDAPAWRALVTDTTTKEKYYFAEPEDLNNFLRRSHPRKGRAREQTGAPETIESARLALIPMTPLFLEACLAGERDAASEIIGLAVPPDWMVERPLMRLRLQGLRKDPALQPWLLRAIALREQQVMIGHIGFHSAPGPADLRELTPGGVEMGYTVYPPYRQQGYATEACEALMTWAHTEHQVSRFVVSISPANLPSLRVAQHLGFIKVGSHVDVVDGVEDIFVRTV